MSPTQSGRPARATSIRAYGEFVIVSGDRDMRPAVEIIYGGDFPAPVHIWAWNEPVTSVYRDLHRNRHAVTLHLLDNHLYAVRDACH